MLEAVQDEDTIAVEDNRNSLDRLNAIIKKFIIWENQHIPPRTTGNHVYAMILAVNAMINLSTKFEVLIFTRHGNIKCVAKFRKWSGLGWLGVPQA